MYINQLHCRIYTQFFCVFDSRHFSHSHRMRRMKVRMKMRSSQSQLRGRSTTQTVRLESRMYRVIQLWSWQERLQKETKLKRCASLSLTSASSSLVDQMRPITGLRKLIGHYSATSYNMIIRHGCEPYLSSVSQSRKSLLTKSDCGAFWSFFSRLSKLSNFINNVENHTCLCQYLTELERCSNPLQEMTE